MKKWTKQQLEAAGKLAQELREQADPQKTVEENMQEALLWRVDDIDAAQVVSQLCEGIQSFHGNLKKAQNQGLPALVDEKLESILDGRTEEEQAQVLYELLTAFAQAAQVQAPAPSGQVDELKQQVREYLCEYGVLNLGSEGAELLLRELGRKELEELTQAQSKVNQEQYTALAFYLQKLQGELETVPDGLTPQEIGALTAAAYKTNQTILDGLLGKLDWERVKRILMMIAGAAIITIMTIAISKVAVFTGTFTVWVVEGVVGMGVIGTIVGAVFGYGVIADIIETTIDTAQSIAHMTHLDDGVKAAACTLRKWFQETVRPKAVQFWSKVKERFGAVESHPAQTDPEAETEPSIQANYTLA